mgnify:CR=1 FL=1
MARPRKWKNVCGMPGICTFVQEKNAAQQDGAALPVVTITVEEFETIRLIDGEDMTQEECARQMKVSRPTVQIIYNHARKKLAGFLVHGGRLQIQGGNYRLCPRAGQGCLRRQCKGEPLEELDETE